MTQMFLYGYNMGFIMRQKHVCSVYFQLYVPHVMKT